VEIHPSYEPVEGAPRTALILFTRQMGMLLDAGVSVLRALRVASQQSGDRRIMQVARELAVRLEDGSEFSRAIGRYPDLFDPFYVEMARQGEEDGILGRALIAVADYLGFPVTGAAGEAPAAERSGSTGDLQRTFGKAAVGAAVVAGLGAAGLLSRRWVGPLIAAWSGYCLLQGGGATLEEIRRTLPRLPAKSRERWQAEADAVVRNAVLEEEEEWEARAAAEAGVPLPNFFDPEPEIGPE